MYRIELPENDVGINASAARGVGRYVQLFHEAFPEIQLPDPTPRGDFVFIHPFFNLLSPFKSLIPPTGARKKIALIHDLIPQEFPSRFPVGFKGRLLKFRNTHSLKNYDAVVTDSLESKRVIIEKINFDPRKIDVIYPYTTISTVPSLDAQLPELPVHFMLYVGDVNWHKNIVNISRAAKIVKFPLVLVGGAFTSAPTDHPWHAEYREFEALEKDNIIVLGKVTEEQLRQLYSKCACNILVSRQEGFGYSYLEASKFKKPSVLADRPIFHEVSGGQGAVFANPESPESIADAMRQLVGDITLRDRLGGEAHSRSEYFSREKFRDDWLRVIES